jgi:hypothetical protein
VDVTALRQELQERLENIVGLTAFGTVPAKPIVPCAIVRIGTINYQDTLTLGSAEVNFTIQILVQMSDWPSMQNALDLYLSTGNAESISDAVEASDLQTQVDRAEPVSMIDYGTVSYGSVTFYGRMLVG